MARQQQRFFDDSIEAYRYQQQVQKPGLAWYVGKYLIGKPLRALVKTLWAWRITVLTVFALFILGRSGVPALMWLLITAIVGVWISSYWKRPLLKFAPLTGDYLRIKAKREHMAKVIAGNGVLLHAGVMS